AFASQRSAGSPAIARTRAIACRAAAVSSSSFGQVASDGFVLKSATTPSVSSTAAVVQAALPRKAAANMKFGIQLFATPRSLDAPFDVDMAVPPWSLRLPVVPRCHEKRPFVFFE